MSYFSCEFASSCSDLGVEVPIFNRLRVPEQIHFFSLITELLQYVASGSNQVATAQAASEGRLVLDI